MSQDFDAQIRALNDKFRDLLPGKLKDIREAWDGAAKGETKDESYENLIRLVHTLAGSGTTFGFAQLSEAAKRLEMFLVDVQQEERPLDHEVVRQVTAGLEDIARAADTSDEESAQKSLKETLADVEESSPGGTEIFWVGENKALAKRIQEQFAFFHFKVRIFNNQTALEDALEQRFPALMVLDLYTSSGRFGGKKSVERIFNATGQGYPRLALCPRGDHLENWLQSIQLGAESCQEKPVDMHQLLERIHNLTTSSKEDPFRIMVMDDDDDLADHINKILSKAGILVKTVKEPKEALEVMDSFRPELILMDLYMPHCSGIDMARLIRQDPRFANIPIVYLSREKEVNKVLEALESGGDDFIFKPVKYRYLYYALTSRIKRARQIGALVEKDSLTGRLKPSALRNHLNDAIEAAGERGTELVLALISIDHLRSINDRYGHAIGDRILKALTIMLARRLGRRAMLGRYGGGEFAVVLPDTTLPLAHQLFDRIRGNFAEVVFHSEEAGTFRVTLSCGLASYPKCSNLEFLRESAERALERAHQQGSNQVVVLDDDEIPDENSDLPEILRLIEISDDEDMIIVEEDDEDEDEELVLDSSGGMLREELPKPDETAIPNLPEPEALDQTMDSGPVDDQLNLDATFEDLDDPEDLVTVLLVDDDPVLLQHTAAVLQQKGYHVWTARNGDEGFNITKKERPDIVLTDLLLFPGIHGFDLCQRIRKDPELKDTRIVLMTAVYKGYRYRMEGKDAGADAFLEKPLDHVTLLNTLATLAGNK